MSNRLSPVRSSTVDNVQVDTRSSDGDDDAVLDFAGFPHLMESIVGYASLSTILNLRLVNRAMKELIDTRIPLHISFESDGRVLPTDKYLLRVQIVDLRTNERAQRPTLPCFCCGTRDGTLSKTHVVHEKAHVQRLIPFLRNVKVVRQWHDACIANDLYAQTLVVFYDFKRWQDAGQMLPGLVYIPRFSAFPQNKLVLNFVFDPYVPLPTDDMCPFVKPPRVREIVIILTPSSNTPGPRPRPDMRTYKRLFMAILNFVPHPSDDPNLIFTFVDANSWEPTWLPDEYSRPPSRRHASRPSMAHLLRTALYRSLPRSSHRSEFDGGERLAHWLSFPTLEEYRDRVGEQQFELETSFDRPCPL